MENNMNVNTNTVQDETGISLNDLIFLIKKNFIMVFIITFIFTLGGAIYGLNFKKITYTSTATAMVLVGDNSGGSGAYQEMLTAQYMINSFKDYINSNLVAKDVINSDECSKYELSIRDVQDNLTVSTQTTNSLVLTLKYKSDNKEEAIEVLNQILDSTEFLSNQQDKLKDTFIIIDKAEEISTIASRGAAIVIIICFVLGAALSFGIVLIKFLLDDTYTSKEAIEKAYNINVIASLPNLADMENGGAK